MNFSEIRAKLDEPIKGPVPVPEPHGYGIPLEIPPELQRLLVWQALRSLRDDEDATE